MSKTDYTYSRSPSYRRKAESSYYQIPNMSRAHVKGSVSPYVTTGDLYVSSDEEDSHYITQKRLSTRTVYEDGILLRSGNSLKNARTVIEKQNIKNRRTLQGVNVNKNARESRRSLQSLSTLDNGRESRSTTRTSRSRRSQASNLVTSTNQMSETRSSTRSSSASMSSLMSSKSSFVDSVRKTLIGEFNDLEMEKGMKEIQNSNRKIKLYGLDQVDSDEMSGIESEVEFTGTNMSGYHSNSSHSRSHIRNSQSDTTTTSSTSTSDSSSSVVTTTTTTVVTTIIETITTAARPVAEPVWKTVGEPIWNHVGRPVWNRVGRPVWRYMCRPLLLLTSRVVSTVLLLLYHLIWTSTLRHLVNGCAFVTRKTLSAAQSIIVQMFVWEVGFFSRMSNLSRMCCIVLPLLLILPLLLFAIYPYIKPAAFIDIRDNDSILDLSKMKGISPHELREHVRRIVIQISEGRDESLSVGEVEKIVATMVEQRLNEEKLANQNRWLEEEAAKQLRDALSSIEAQKNNKDKEDTTTCKPNIKIEDAASKPNLDTKEESETNIDKEKKYSPSIDTQGEYKPSNDTEKACKASNYSEKACKASIDTEEAYKTKIPKEGACKQGINSEEKPKPDVDQLKEYELNVDTEENYHQSIDADTQKFKPVVESLETSKPNVDSGIKYEENTKADEKLNTEMGNEESGKEEEIPKPSLDTAEKCLGNREGKENFKQNLENVGKCEKDEVVEEDLNSSVDIEENLKESKEVQENPKEIVDSEGKCEKSIEEEEKPNINVDIEEQCKEKDEENSKPSGETEGKYGECKEQKPRTSVDTEGECEKSIIEEEKPKIEGKCERSMQKEEKPKIERKCEESIEREQDNLSWDSGGKCEESGESKANVDTEGKCEGTEPKTNVDTEETFEKTKPKTNVDTEETCEETKPKSNVDTEGTCEESGEPKTNVDTEGKCEGTKPKTNVDTEGTFEETKPKTNVNTEGKCEETKPKTNVDTEGTFEETKPKSNVDTEGKCEETKPKSNVNTEETFEKTKPKTNVDTEGKCEETKSKTNVDTKGTFEETKPKSNVNSEGKCEETTQKTNVNTEGKCEETKPKTNMDTEGTFEETKPKTNVNTEGKCEETKPKTNVDIEETFEETKPKTNVDTEGTCEKTNPKTNVDIEGKCEENLEADESLKADFDSEESSPTTVDEKLTEGTDSEQIHTAESNSEQEFDICEEIPDEDQSDEAALFCEDPAEDDIGICKADQEMENIRHELRKKEGMSSKCKMGGSSAVNAACYSPNPFVGRNVYKEILLSPRWKCRYVPLPGKDSTIDKTFRNKKCKARPMSIEKNRTQEFKEKMNITEEILRVLQHLNVQGDSLTEGDIRTIVGEVVQHEVTGLQERITEQAQSQVSKKKESGEVMLALQNDLKTSITNLEQKLADELERLKSHTVEGSDATVEASASLLQIQDDLTSVRARLDSLELEKAWLAGQLKNCCRNETFYTAMVQDKINLILGQIMSGNDTGTADQYLFGAWLNSTFIKKSDLEKYMADFGEELSNKILQEMSRTEATEVYVSDSGGQAVVTEKVVKQIVTEALEKFSADKIALPDFALESAGGSIISTKCSETFHKNTARLSILGIPLWYVSNSPRSVIQPETQPGSCWAFQGDKGHLVIELSDNITPTAFTLEHIPKSLAPEGKIDSAPKDFTVIGLNNENDKVGERLGNFTYTDRGPPLQTFKVQKPNVGVYKFVQLSILSNHGNPLYTCLYRFRVHGIPHKPKKREKN